MDDDQNALAEALSGDNEDVENGGVGPGDAEEQGNALSDQDFVSEDDPKSVKKRLGMQAKKHQREMRALHERIAHMESRYGGDSANPHDSMFQSDPYTSPGQPNPPGQNEEERIQRAVRMALGMKDQEERQAQEAQRMAHVHKQYQRLNDEFDRASDKYEDFDEVVRESDAPFTDAVRDALLLIENPAEVAYRLGKSRSDLERISKLHPLDQAKEVTKLSFSLMGNHGKPTANQKPAPMGSIRQNPANASRTITDKTPPSEIRARMKAGTWK